MTHITDEEIKTNLKERAPEKARDIEGMEFGEIKEYVMRFMLTPSRSADIEPHSLKRAVSEDMEILKASPYLSKNVKVLGFLFDIFDGSLEEIKL